jgi:hypothetical protein
MSRRRPAVNISFPGAHLRPLLAVACRSPQPSTGGRPSSTGRRPMEPCPPRAPPARPPRRRSAGLEFMGRPCRRLSPGARRDAGGLGVAVPDHGRRRRCCAAVVEPRQGQPVGGLNAIQSGAFMMSPLLRPGGWRRPGPAARIEYHQRPPDARHCERHQNHDDDGQADEDHDLLPSATPGGAVRRWRLLPRAPAFKFTQVVKN